LKIEFILKMFRWIASGWISFFLLRANAVPCDSFEKFYREGQRYYQAQQFLMASVQFKLSSQFACDADLQGRGLFSYALAMNELSERNEVFASLRQIRDLPGPELHRRANLFEVVELKTKMPESLEPDQAQRVHAWNTRAFLDVPTKSPWVAGGLSAVIPGAGQAYVGAWQSGLYSFVINSLFLATALELNRKGLQTSSLAAGAVFSVTYFGGILAATQAAHLYNENQVRPFETDLHRKLFPELSP
jgi:hypothetical protein